MSKIFISHSSVNNAAALAVVRWLEENGWGDYFLDITPSQGLSPGERWRAALKAAADRCEVVLFLISPAWRDSKECLLEFYLAKQLGKTIFGAIIDATPLDTLSKEMTAEWQLCDLVAGAERWTQRVYHDPLVPETYISFAQAGLVRLKIGLKKSGLNPSTFQWPPDHDKDRAPYRGLKALEAEDAAVFFGREQPTIRGLDTIRTLREHGVEQMLVILGASGAGKSSFLRAGLWPRLKRDDRHFLPLPVIRPERAAISGPTGLVASLEAAFRERNVPRNRADIRKALEEPGGFDRVVAELQSLAHQALGPETDPPTVVIPIDQGEELFGAEGRAEADAFLSLLGQTLASPTTEGAEAIAARRRAIAIVAIRSDTYEWLQTEAKIEGIKRTLFDLMPIARTEFKSVIEGPAKRATDAGRKLKVDAALTERLLQDAEGADALPLLAFTLERLFIECGGDGDLRLDEYQSLGGVQGSIETAITAAFREPERKPAVPIDKMEREVLLRQAFIPWLAGVDPETEKPKRRIARLEEIPTDARPLLERLIGARLLVRDRRKIEDSSEEAVIVEVAHEALLRQWPTLTTWLDAEADALKTAEAVRRAAGEWTKKRPGEAWLLHTGERLDAAEALQRRPDFQKLLGEEGRNYLAVCRAKEDTARAEREAQLQRIAEQQAQIGAEQERVAQEQERTARLQRWARQLLTTIAVITIATGGWIVYQARDVAHQTSRVLAAAAKEASDAGHYDQALRYAVLAAHENWLSPAVPEAEAQLARGAQASLLAVLIEGHTGTVRSAIFSPDGQRIVTASEDYTARVWDAKTGQMITELTGHEGFVVSAIFSQDGKRIVTASDDKSARVWDAETGQLTAELTGHSDRVRSAVFSPDGQRIVTASNDGTAKVWDIKTGQLVANMEGHTHFVNSAEFSPDGKHIVTASSDDTARVWDAQTGQLVFKLKGHTHILASAIFSPNGERIVTASVDHTARIWDSKTGQLITKLTGHEESVSSAAFSRDGQRIVTASVDKTAVVWDAKTGKEIAGLVEHEAPVYSAVFSPDGKRIVTASEDKTARVWDANTGKELIRLTGHSGRVDSVSFSPDGQRVVTTSDDGTARVWNAKGEQLITELKGHSDQVESAVFSPDGQRVVTASEDQTARVWDANTGKELIRLTGHSAAVRSAVFSPDGQQIVTASSEDKTARVWDAKTGQLITVVTGLARLSPDGKAILTNSNDGTVRLWDTNRGQLITELRELTGHGRHWLRGSDKDRIVTASKDDETVQLWDAKTGQLQAELKESGYHVSFAVFSPDRQRILTDSVDPLVVRVWDSNTGQLITELAGPGGTVWSAIFSPDGQRIVAAFYYGSPQVWDAKTGQLIMELKGHGGSVFSVAFSPDGQQIVTSSVDNTARVWDAKTGQVLTELTGHDEWVVAAVFSPDGRRVATTSKDKTARVWDVHWLTQYKGQELIAAVCREKLAGACILTERDVAMSPILSGRRGEDVCAPPSFSFFSRIGPALGLKTHTFRPAMPVGE